MRIDETSKVSDIIQVWPLGSGELPRFGSNPKRTMFYFSGLNGNKVCKVDSGGRENDFGDYAELMVPLFEISFKLKNDITEEISLKQFEKIERKKLDQLIAAAKSNGNKILFDESFMAVRSKPTCLPILDTSENLWYEEIGIALLTKKKRGEIRNDYVWPIYAPFHKDGCHINSLTSKPYGGICTCGAGLDYLKRHKSDKYMMARKRK